MTPYNQDIVAYNYRGVWHNMAQGVSYSHIHVDNTAWGKWLKFITLIGIHANFSSIVNPVLIIQIFAHYFCSVFLAVSIFHIQKRLVKKYPCLIEHIFAKVGGVKPLVDLLSNINF